MTFLTMRRAELDSDAVPRFDALVAQLSTRMQPLLGPARQKQADTLGVDIEKLSMFRGGDQYIEEIPYDCAEIFVDSECLFVISIRPRSSFMDEENGKDEKRTFAANVISPHREIPNLGKFIETCSEVMGVTFKPYRYTSSDFHRLKGEAIASGDVFSPEDVGPSRVLASKDNRELATRIKQSYGLLVSDLSKKGARDQSVDVATARAALETAGLISSEFMVICTKNSQQTARAPSAEVIARMDEAGVKCACGKPISQERLEEALTITDHGRSLIDKSKWLSVLVTDELLRLGVQRDEIIIESTIGGDELDCIASINGEVCLFELKDKEFNLREAYSFGAKMNIVNPDHSVIVTSEYVGGDARDHFERSRKAGRSPRSRRALLRREKPLLYVEGMDRLNGELEDLVRKIHGRDARRVLGDILGFAALEPGSLLTALEHKRASTGEGRATSEGRRTAPGPRKAMSERKATQARG